MANTLDSMDIKQILRLHLDGLSNRYIGKMLSISRNTINSYIKKAQSFEGGIDALLSKERNELTEFFTSHTTLIDKRYEELMSWFDKINIQRNHTGFTFRYHHEEYKSSVSNPYGYTQFMEHFHRKYDIPKGSMKLEHESGKEVYVDYAGKKLQIVNKDTGEIIPVEVFVAILPYSHYTYVRACHSQKKKDFINCLSKALSYYGGVPKAIVSDNLKSAVTRACKYEPKINLTFKEFGEHYNCVVNPTRSYSPQDKALVENAVSLTYQRIYYPLREMTFFSLDELNKEIEKLLEKYNNLLLQKRGVSRRELFLSSEHNSLKPLPNTAFEIKDYTKAKVQKIGYVYFSPDKNYYSVPYIHIGKSTDIHYTDSLIEVYCEQERIATHKRDAYKKPYNTIKEHLSSAHKAYTSWNPDYFKKMAAKHGENVLSVIEHIFINCDYPETLYKRAMGIIQLHKKYSSQELDKACERALLIDNYSYTKIHSILKSKQDITTDSEQDINTPHIPIHENIRGNLEYT